jgi:AcrR family transcriptional regulator
VPKVTEAYRDNRRRQILDAAIECFAREGFQRTTMENIIREAGLSAGAIYLYFQSKEQIIEKLADERHQREKLIIESALKQGDWNTSLRELFRSFVESLADPGVRKERRLGIHVWAEALCNPKVRTLIRRGTDQPLRLLASAVEEAQRKGQLSATVKPEQTARVLMALFHGLILQQAWDERMDVAAFAQTAQTMAASYLARGPKTRPAKLSPTL